MFSGQMFNSQFLSAIGTLQYKGVLNRAIGFVMRVCHCVTLRFRDVEYFVTAQGNVVGYKLEAASRKSAAPMPLVFSMSVRGSPIDGKCMHMRDGYECNKGSMAFDSG